MASPRTPALLIAAALATAVLAGCDGGEGVATQAGSSAGGTGPPAAAVPAGTAALEPAVVLSAPGAVPGLDARAPRRLTSARAAVEVLYRPGDPAAADARRRLEAAGYSGGVLRDQAGSDPDAGLALLRTYALALGDEDAARAEVRASIAEVRASTRLPIEEVAPGIPDARAIRIDLRHAGARVRVLFVTFAVGSRLHGVQAFARGGGAIPQAAVLRAVADVRAASAAGG